MKELMSTSLAMAMNLEYERYKKFPELLELNSKCMEQWAEVLGEQGDALQFRQDNSEEIFVVLVRILTYMAIMSKTGIDFNGCNYNLPMP